jgi:hypothetical protein
LVNYFTFVNTKILLSMKKITSVLCIVVLAAVAAHAQDYKKFRVGLGLGHARPGGDGAKAGLLFFLEPGYRINDAMLVNLRMEFAAMARGIAGADGSADFDVTTSGSYTLNFQYFFMSETFRPFAGLGFGTYSCKGASASVSSGQSDVTIGVADANKIGFYPRVGFDAGHFQLSIDYNIIGATKESFDLGSGQTIDLEQKNSYLGLRLGLTIGGGRK